MTTKNWFGMDAHPTDDKVHWTEVKTDSKGRLKKEFVGQVNELRDAYDTIVAAGFKAELEVCMRRSYEQGQNDEADMHNEDL